jgi:hypothetical protein
MPFARVIVWAAGMTMLPLSSCAWSNVDNRPVWNAFEQHLVPAGDGLFVVSLPVTIPVGLASIVVDTVIAHPIQVVDDAYDDARLAWDPDSFDFQDAYYTELSTIPGRVVATPLVFSASFLARCLFDLPASKKPISSAEKVAERRRREVVARLAKRNSFIAWLREPDALAMPKGVVEWHESFHAPMRAALSSDALRRADLHVGMLKVFGVRVGNYDGKVGLRDPDPIVRYQTIKNWPRNGPILSAELLQSLFDDAAESVRLAARQRFR